MVSYEEGDVGEERNVRSLRRVRRWRGHARGSRGHGNCARLCAVRRLCGAHEKKTVGNMSAARPAELAQSAGKSSTNAVFSLLREIP